jgi:crotonobetainyl-CoA:carnitine CoA-transferase CaiB-like acyl-CoA transferase
MLDTLVNDADPTRRGNRDDLFAPHGCYPVAGEDQWIAVAVADDRGWQDLCRLLGDDALAGVPRFATANERRNNIEELDTAVAELTREHDGAEFEARLQAAGIACHRVQDSAAACSDPQLKARGHFVRLQSGEAYTIVEDTRSKLSRTPAKVRRGVPTLGRDNMEILEELLDYDADKMTGLAIAGVLE